MKNKALVVSSLLALALIASAVYFYGCSTAPVAREPAEVGAEEPSRDETSTLFSLEGQVEEEGKKEVLTCPVLPKELHYKVKGWGGAEGGARRNKKRRGGKKRKRRGGKVHRTGPPRRRPKGYCVCPACGAKVAVYTEVPCYIMNCAKCGSQMVKQSSSAKHPQGIPQE